MERSSLASTRAEAKQKVLDLVQKGRVILEFNQYRYIQSGDFYLPCVKWPSKGERAYRVKTVMTWDMVENRLQQVVDRYATSS